MRKNKKTNGGENPTPRLPSSWVIRLTILYFTLLYSNLTFADLRDQASIRLDKQ